MSTVGDTDLNAVFKFDSQFALVKKFGHKELKWPRGITYDRDLDGDHAANKLYAYTFVYINLKYTVSSLIDLLFLFVVL